MDLKINSNLIEQIKIRVSISSLTKEFIEKLKRTDESDNHINIILEFFLLADRMKPISCDKKTQNLQGLQKE